mmetsp:Transcript_5396/g.13334  ORF Transcript_5396/g.13334 Transcript_5396/m.13334 type:complete len:299 (+) Transcript_5396:399-1295(+)
MMPCQGHTPLAHPCCSTPLLTTVQQGARTTLLPQGLHTTQACPCSRTCPCTQATAVARLRLACLAPSRLHRVHEQLEPALVAPAAAGPVRAARPGRGHGHPHRAAHPAADAAQLVRDVRGARVSRHRLEILSPDVGHLPPVDLQQLRLELRRAQELPRVGRVLVLRHNLQRHVAVLVGVERNVDRHQPVLGGPRQLVTHAQLLHHGRNLRLELARVLPLAAMLLAAAAAGRLRAGLGHGRGHSVRVDAVVLRAGHPGALHRVEHEGRELDFRCCCDCCRCLHSFLPPGCRCLCGLSLS